MADGHPHHRAHGHVHGFGGSTLRALVLALILNAAYTVVEAVTGVLTDSLALLSDAGHNLSDVLALAVAAGAVWLARRPPTLRTSFGLKRAEILAALVNAVTLIAIAIVVIVAAVRRLADPPEVPGGWLIVVAAVGLLINTVGAALVFRRGGRDLNLRASFLHLAGDALGSLGVIVAGIVIVVTGWPYADPIFSIVLALLILATSWFVLRDAVLVLLEAAPRDVDVRQPGSSRCTTSTSGRSRPTSPRSPRTCSSTRVTTAMRCGGRSRRCSTIASPSITRRCRSSTARATGC
jgi:cobalt-zinc-cadmium efflux system protein